MNIAFVPFYVRWMGIEAYGLVGIFTVLQTCMTLLDGGLTPTLSRELALLQAGARSPQSIRNLIFSSEVLYCFVIVIVGIFFTIAAPLLASHWVHIGKLSLSSVEGALRIMGIVLGLRWLSSLYRGAHVGLQQQVWLASCSSIFATLRGFGSMILLANVTPTINVFFTYQGFVAVLEAFVLGAHLRKVLAKAPKRAQFSIPELLGIWRFAAGVTLLTLMGVVLTQFDKLLLSKLLPLSSFGYYVIASSVASSLYFLVAPISNVSYPRFTTFAARASDSEVADMYHKFSQFTAVAVMPASLVLIVFAHPLIFIWSGNLAMTDAVAPLVRVLACGNMLHGLMHIPYMLQLAYGWTRFNVILNMVAIVLLLPAIYFVATKYGALGAAYVWVVLNLSYLLIATPLMHRKLLRSEMWRWYRVDVFFPLLGGLGGIGLVLAVFPTNSVGEFEQVVIIAVAAAASLGAAAIATPMGRAQLLIIAKRTRP